MMRTLLTTVNDEFLYMQSPNYVQSSKVQSAVFLQMTNICYGQQACTDNCNALI